MSGYDYDFFVIGCGSGGVRAARVAAGHGARVAVCEERYLGGTCVNVGCIPKKLLVYAAHFHDDFEDAAGYGWTLGEAGFDWSRLIANKDREIARLNGLYRGMLERAGAKLVWGRGMLVDDHTVAVEGRRYSAERILIATGGWPAVPEFPGREHVVTSNEAFHLERAPSRAMVVGGGYIAVEFAGIFHGLGVEVVQLYRGPLFLRGFDDDVRRHLADEYRARGIDLRFDAEVAGIERDGESLTVALNDGSRAAVDLVMYATGRRPLTAGLGLDRARGELDAGGAIKVDDAWRTSVPHIYAVGDVIDRIQLTPVALNEGHILADQLFGGRDRDMSYENVPSAVFSQPPIGTVGLTEAEARARYGEVDIYKTDFSALKNTLSGRAEKTLMKLVVEPVSDRVVGIHMVGPEAGEIVQGFAVAMKAGATKRQFDATIAIHPTSAEELVTMRERYRPQAAAQAAQ
ncbi:MAG: glutathione-disulfide reductase [Alphaproteobacteria bacterium]|nr:glutathione-disulfide reductase [Alphaproteobacteria bacterium]